jgi:hypothetical protein
MRDQRHDTGLGGKPTPEAARAVLVPAVGDWLSLPRSGAPCWAWTSMAWVMSTSMGR